ncbi:hypothetical protein RJT34_09658 [Clitoria ternatea]|uniref:Uncharacterized protein n=1 Tax=Clitoria ternatea TaxID=43366 RepID=A0AAN9K8G4_CLITE
MALSRRPARFKRPAFMPTKEISPETMKSLRVGCDYEQAAAARVYVTEQDPEDKSLEVNTAAAAENVTKEEDFDRPVELLAGVASGIETEVEKKEPAVEQKIIKTP